ncbi:pilus assembly protein [Denitrificimonas caeni]|uniref:PilC/PilY family type IV pilus protein n=1 Tax=Denitrificimonas caeni TaxID=521720 RepID=A0AAE9VTL0_9GAMM|nr:PilC/PilY family type IV pilus protein [Denitrificimonas caeni]WBE24736.1 PilC/PilY family type IV pilus protein [Denitrificimonas caeni]
MKNNLLIAFSCLALTGALQAAPLDISDAPIFVNSAVPPLNLLVMGKDHKLYYEAYSDNSDLDGDSVIDVGYKPEQIDYFGYFNSNLCYTHSGGKFIPKEKANNKKCSSKWSGDFLNYLATSRMDALRKVLYGGYRSVDKTDETVLQAAYIPRDGHSWGKEYNPARDAYSIKDYAPYSEPAVGHYHLFAVTTDTHDSNAVPSLKVLTNTKYRVWEWVSKEAPVASDSCWAGACTGKGPANSLTMLPESVVSGLSMTVWGHSNNSQPNSRAEMNSQFSGSKTICGSTPVNHINSVIGNNGFTVKNNNNIFAGANSSCFSNEKYMVEIKGKLKLTEGGSYKFRSMMRGSLDFTIGTQRFESYDGGWNDKNISLAAGEHDITLRYLKAKRDGEDYWEMQWIPAGNTPKSKMDHYAIKIDVCPASNSDLREDNCQAYPNKGGKAVYKPTGLLHDFGAEDKMYFGLLTGSYENNIDGGVLRNNIDSFTKEIDPQTGIYKSAYKGVVNTINNLKLYGFGGTQYTGCGLLANPLDTYSNQKCHMWGNPVAEMMYEGLRYFSGADKATPSYSYTQNKSVDSTLSLEQPKWESPYRDVSKGGYPACAKPVMTVVSDITPSYDYNVPGSKWSSKVGSDAKLAKPLDVGAQVDAIWQAEGGGSRSVFIGESNGQVDYAPSPKVVSNLSTVRGLSPEEPSKNGTYYSAGVARFGATDGVQVNSTTNNSMMTYAVALASPLPQIKFPNGKGGTVTLVPFGKSVGGGYGMDARAEFQPTLTIVDFYVQALVNTDPKGSDRDDNVNGGRPYAQFRINYEDVEQGNDHDMDAIVLYTIYINEQGKLVVKLDKEYEAAGIHMHMGYMVSGTTVDGIYLDVKSKGNTAYRLNTPPGRAPGYCANLNNSGCNNLPEHTVREFTVTAQDGAELLPGPLWYAAKYGMPNRDPATVEGDPDNYFLVTNALTLKDQLTKAFNDIMQKNAAVTRPAIGKAPIGPTVAQERSLYRTEFDAEKWTGSLVKETLDLTTNQPVSVWESSIPSTRTVKMAQPSGVGLTSFTWAQLENRTFAGKNLQATFSVNENGDTDSNGPARVEYIVGDKTKENSLFRPRSSLLGDIVNSSPALVAGAQYIPYIANKLFGTNNYADFVTAQAAKTPMIYVGANDGMLHGFDANSGEEKFAFIPTPVIEKLHLLTQKTYGVTGQGAHSFYVDGSLHVSDVYIDNEWKTILVGALGAGGRGVFALDVTNPDAISLLWEFTQESAGSLNATSGLSDLGYTFGSPMIIKLKSGEWVAAISSGYNSPNAESGVASLFLLDISTGAVVSKLDAKGQVTNNGLSSFRVADYNSDGLADYIYAGDIQGNLWRFDFTQTTPSISYGAKPLFKAERPITAAPNLVRHPSGVGYLIVVGTGRYLANSDKIPPFSLDSVYGIWDQKTKGEATTALMAVNKSELLKQNFFLQTVADIGDDDKKVTQEIRLLTKKSPNWSTGQHKGWAIDLNVEGNATPDGERMVDEMTVRGEVLFFSTRRPSTDPCESGVEGWTYAVNPSTGGRTDFNVLDLNRSLMVGAEDGYLHGGTLIPVTGFKAPPGGFILTGDKMISSDGTVMDYQARSSNKNRESWFVIPKGKAE